MKTTSATWVIFAIVGALLIVGAWIFLGGDPPPATQTPPAAGADNGATGGTRAASQTAERQVDDPLTQSIHALRDQYHLAGAARLDALSRTADEQVRLSDQQRERINVVNEAISRRAADALREVRSEQADLKARARSLEDATAMDAKEAAGIKRQLLALMAREQEIAGELDRQYMEMMSRELTPEQMRVLSGQPKPEDVPEVRPPRVEWIPPEEAEALRRTPAEGSSE